MDIDMHTCASTAAIERKSTMNTATNLRSVRRPVALTNTTHYFQGRPNVVFLDRFAGRASRHTRTSE
jgi:hypothetical protein